MTEADGTLVILANIYLCSYPKTFKFVEMFKQEYMITAIQKESMALAQFM